MIDGKPMIAHVAAWLADQCGLLGSLLAAMEQAACPGIVDTLLVARCDMPRAANQARPVAGDRACRRGEPMAPGPVAHARRLRALLLTEGAISMRCWVAVSSARTVALGARNNIN